MNGHGMVRSYLLTVSPLYVLVPFYLHLQRWHSFHKLHTIIIYLKYASPFAGEKFIVNDDRPTDMCSCNV